MNNDGIIMNQVYFNEEEMFKYEGSTKPILGYRNNDRFIVKYMVNPMGGKVVVNEFVSSSLLDLLEIKTPRFFLSVVTKDMPTMGGYIEKGEIVFCSQYIEHLPLTSANLFSRVQNKSQFLDFLVFDAFIFNTDRSDVKKSYLLNLGNIIFSSLDKNIYLIDHSHILTYNISEWNENLLRLLEVPHKNIINRLFELTIYDTLFNNGFLDCESSYVDKIKSKYAKIGVKEIENIVDEIPSSWICITTLEKEKLVDFLVGRLKQVNSIIDMIIKKIKGEQI